MKVNKITGFGPPKVYYSDNITKDYFYLASRPPGLQHMLLVDMDVQTRRIANKKADETMIKLSDNNLDPIDPEDSSDDEVDLSSDGYSSDDLDPVDHGALGVNGTSDVDSNSVDHSAPVANGQLDPELYNGPIIEFADEDEDDLDDFKEPEHEIIREQLREIVTRDASETLQIDMVRFVGLDNHELPSRLTWEVLDDLRPRHLELGCGYAKNAKSVL